MSDVDAQTLWASYCTMAYGLQEGTVATREAWEYSEKKKEAKDELYKNGRDGKRSTYTRAATDLEPNYPGMPVH